MNVFEGSRGEEVRGRGHHHHPRTTLGPDEDMPDGREGTAPQLHSRLLLRWEGARVLCRGREGVGVLACKGAAQFCQRIFYLEKKKVI